MNRRDDFTDKVKRLLRERAGNQCSNPGCRAVTTGAAEHPEKVNSVGKAAHICAAAPGGPRFKEEMTREERRSIENGIWLCSTHADEIDNDENRFPESLLRQWKKDAEESRKNQIGKPLPRPSDATDLLTTALTGFPKRILPTAIENTHKATEQVLGELDQRFDIESSYHDGITSFHYHAREDVQLKMTVAAENAREFAEKFQRLETHGEDVTIDSSAVHFQGSRLLEETPSFFKGGNLNIQSERKEAITRLRLVQKDSGIEEVLPDAPGVIRHGSQALTFEGSLFGGMIKVAYTGTFSSAEREGSITLSPNLDSWQGKQIARLPYLDSLQTFLSRMEGGWILEGTLEAEGLRLFSFDLNQLSDREDGIADYLRYLQSAGYIAEFLAAPIKFFRDYLPTIAEFEKVMEAAKIVRKELVLSNDDISGPIVSSLVANDDSSNVAILQARKGPTAVKFVENEGQAILCMGEPLQMPPRETTLLNVVPKLEMPKGGIKPGDIVDVEWIPAKGFQVVVTYL